MRIVVRNTATLTALSTLCLSLLGCASATPPASSVTAAAATHSAEPRPGAKLEPAAASEPAKPAAEPAPADDAPTPPADEPGDGLRKASRPPMDLLMGNNVVYVFNFPSSAKGVAAKERCESAGDPGAVRQCLIKEREKIAVESVRFVKDGSGQYWWVTYNRYKGNLLKWHRIQFMPGKHDADSISLTLIGKDKGIAPLARVPASLKIELPNDYSIVVSDPEHGAMTFDAKIGLMDTE